MAQKLSYKQLEQRVRELEKQSEQLKQSKERYRSLIETAPVAIMAIRDGCILFANKAGARLLGFSDPDKMVGIPTIDVVAPESQQLVTERIKRLESGKDNPAAEIALIRQDGNRIIVEARSVSIHIDGVSTAILIAQDIGDRKEKEEKLQMMQYSMDKALDRIAWIAPDGRFLYANEAACEEMAYTLDEVLSMRVSDIDPDFPIVRWTEHYQGVKKRGSIRLETQQIAGDGKIHDIEVSTNVLKFGDREFMCSFGRDITERRQKEKEIKQYKRIIESTNNPIGLVDRNFIYQYVNEPYCQALKMSAKEIIGHSVPELFGRNFFESVMEPHYKRCFAGENVNYQEWYDFPGWGRRYMDVCYYPFREADGRITAVVTNVHDITEIKQIDMELIESQERFQAFMDNIPAAVYIKDENDRHIYGNPEAFESVKMKPEKFIGSTTRDFWSSKLADRLIELDRKVMHGKIPRITEEWRNTEMGDTHWRRDIKFPIELSTGKKFLGGIAIDITEIKQNEQELRDAYRKIEKLKQKLEQENIYLREEIEVNYKHEEIIGKSKPVMKMLNRAEQVAETNSTVLILGETGTGKELLARSIHKLSPHKNRQMIKVNCAALPATLIESELFGRERGAYTGAMTRQIGRFEIADGSTIFLDEIGELPLDVQVKLLRVLQEGQFERLGNPQTISVNVRIIASTNRDLARAVGEGRFRGDLYYRLNVFSVTVPPLRDRIEDIPLLVWALVKEFEKSMGKTIERIPQKSIDMLQQYSWPGNIRELRNVIESAMIISTGKILKLKPPVAPSLNVPQDLKLEAVERNHIIDVLGKTSWRVSGEKGAAKLLGLKPTTLEARMKKLGIKRPK
ncbi:MAG: sigma 54-interacting transcriptional regulator [Planctomycetota bacterium]|jgi:PAS domain S-box-containing protein